MFENDGIINFRFERLALAASRSYREHLNTCSISGEGIMILF